MISAAFRTGPTTKAYVADAVDRHRVKHLEAKPKLEYRLYTRPSLSGS